MCVCVCVCVFLSVLISPLSSSAADEYHEMCVLCRHTFFGLVASFISISLSLPLSVSLHPPVSLERRSIIRLRPALDECCCESHGRGAALVLVC